MNIKNLQPLSSLSEFDNNIIRLCHFAINLLENIPEIKGLGVKIIYFSLSTKETLNVYLNDVIYLTNPHKPITDFNSVLFSGQALKIQENTLGFTSTKEVFKEIKLFNDKYIMDKIIKTYPEDLRLHHRGQEEKYLTQDNYMIELEDLIKTLSPHLEVELEKLSLEESIATQNQSKTKIKM